MEFSLVNKTTLITAKRGSGKSILCRYLVKAEMDKFDEIFVICPTEDCNHFYSSFLDKRNIFTEFDPGWLEQFYKKIENNVKEGNKQNVLLILDDCGSEQDFKKNPIIQRVFTRGRHHNISIIILQQQLYMVSPQCRANSDWLFSGQSTQKSIEILAEEFLVGNLTKREFIKMYHKSSSDHYFLLINNNSVKDANDISQLYSKIRVPKEYLN